MRTISQNPNENQTGISLWTLADVEKAQAKQKADALAMEVERQANAMDDEDEFGDGGISDRMLADFDMDA